MAKKTVDDIAWETVLAKVIDGSRPADLDLLDDDRKRLALAALPFELAVRKVQVHSERMERLESVLYNLMDVMAHEREQFASAIEIAESAAKFAYAEGREAHEHIARRHRRDYLQGEVCETIGDVCYVCAHHPEDAPRRRGSEFQEALSDLDREREAQIDEARKVKRAEKKKAAHEVVAQRLRRGLPPGTRIEAREDGLTISVDGLGEEKAKKILARWERALDTYMPW